MAREIPITEITIRKFEKPYPQEREELIKKFCISLGLLQPGDSRDIIIDILNLFLEANKEKKLLKPEEIYKNLSKIKKEGNAPSNIRRHLKRLKVMNIIEKFNKGYRIKEWLSLKEVVKKNIKNNIIAPILDRIEEYADLIDST